MLSHETKLGRLYVHYGCSYECAPDRWLNFDSSYTLRFERLPIIGKRYTKNAKRFPAHVRYGDIVKGLPVPDKSAEAVYASHVLEHLPLQDFHRALDNTFRILKPDGVFRVVVPDLESLAQEYLDGMRNGDPKANDRFLRRSCLGYETQPRTLKEIIYHFLRTSAHFWMWDYPSLMQALTDHGFCNVRPCKIGDSGDSLFSLVEDPGRFEKSVALEARRPGSQIANGTVIRQAAATLNTASFSSSADPRDRH